MLGSVVPVALECRNETCAVCMLMNKLDQRTMTALGLKRNERLTAMLELALKLSSCDNIILPHAIHN